MYNPKPVDTSNVILSDELLELTEKIAENVHDVWAIGRIKEGWKYGIKKDIEKKETNQLVPYNELPESEKDYDRNTALETLKLVIKLGYKITKIEDMALSRSDAMERCISLGKKFIEHFDKIYKDPNCQAVNHWTSEMQGWLNNVREIKLKTTNKTLLDGNLRDWFFTAGALPEDFMTNAIYEELEAYDKFVNLILNGKTIIEALKEI